MNNALWLLRFARSATTALIGSVLARLLGHLLGIVVLALPAWLLGVYLTRAVPTTQLVVTLMIIFAAALLKAALRYLEQYLGHLAAFRLLGQLRLWVVDKLIPQAPALNDGLGTAKLHTVAIRDVDRVEVFFAHTIAPAFTAVVIPATAIGVAGVVAGAAVAVAVAVVVATGLALALWGGRGNTEAARRLTDTRVELAQYLSDSVKLRETVLLNGAVADRLRGAAALDEQLAVRRRHAGRSAGFLAAASSLRSWGGTVAVLAVGLHTLEPESASLPGVLAASVLILATAPALESVERLSTSLPLGLAATSRIREVAATPPSVTEPDHPTPIALVSPAGSHNQATGPAVELSQVSFRYAGASVAALQEVSFTVAPGEFVGIIGPSGSGKTTVAALLQRHRDPTSGRVLIHGIDATELGSAQVYRQVFVVDQNPFLIEGTMAENLRLGAPQATEAELAWALAQAALPTSEVALDTPVGRRGARLSGGQRQRVALARTLLRARAMLPVSTTGTGQLPGAIVVFDEATSHLDQLSQRQVMDNIRRLGATVVLIAHRLSTVTEADSVIVIEGGRVVEQGSLTQLRHI